MGTYELLDALNLKDVRTTAQVAERLGVDEREAARQLLEAATEGLAHEDVDLSASISDDADREYWMLTPEGRELWDRLDAQRARA